MKRLVALGMFFAIVGPLAAQSPDDFPAFIRAETAKLDRFDAPPSSKDQAFAWNKELRKNLLDAWGGFPAEPCPLNAKVLGAIERDGYRVEKLVFQTRPNVWMTANAYVPKIEGKTPALLMVHGHWRGAKQDRTVQARCIGAAKLGFFVLVVDAFGAGERGIGKALGEYHGEMTAATLLPVGLPLSGLQVYENMRAVDYLLTRPEVDGKRIGISGASGGGNQTMYAGSWDDRIAAAVPVCSVGNYRAYLHAACCMCEVVPGALRFAEEGRVLGLTAPRALLVINATKDGIQFSPAEAKKSVRVAETHFRVFDKVDNIKHTLFESQHDYSKPMREAMYGWMTLHLKGQGDGSPIPEPAMKTEDPESLRCYPGDTRPADWVTIPKFAAAEGEKILAELAKRVPTSREDWKPRAAALSTALRSKVGSPAQIRIAASTGDEFDFEPEPGIRLKARIERRGKSPLVVLLDLDGAEKARSSPLAKAIREAGLGLVTCDLRATGKLAWPKDKVGKAPDHNTAEWALWLGRPLLFQWAHDLRCLRDILGGEAIDAVVGEGPAGVVVLCAAAVDPTMPRVVAVGSLGSYVTGAPYLNQRLGIMAPGILRDVGDIDQIAALAQGRVIIAGPVRGDGTAMSKDEAAKKFAYSNRVHGDRFRLLDSADPAAIVDAIQEKLP